MGSNPAVPTNKKEGHLALFFIGQNSRIWGAHDEVLRSSKSVAGSGFTILLVRLRISAKAENAKTNLQKRRAASAEGAPASTFPLSLLYQARAAKRRSSKLLLLELADHEPA